ncbi:GntR family transcriptional regulator [Roseimicrobium gellanilyticum]|uniref:GntR family transcriptional regulator n=1 Tax=Roseimicrobium gellanilyticum TaxID=748857 RepID=A0A366HTC7_9BACT|nr:GntR family transcriptional regulator [Roseimicrobium gellanilyticum]RBP47533.1 GntR family transcriptional regulator [Roseimicrobium gellanilyticum]
MSSLPPNGLQAIRRSTLAEEVAAQVRRAIISGQIAEGSQVSEPKLAEQLHVSRVPVREALAELEHDGVVVFDHRGRCQVRQFTKADFEEILSLRLNLELMSVKLAAEKVTSQDLALLKSNLDALEEEKDVTNISRLDVEFHDLIMQAARHERLRVCWHTVRTQFELLLAKAHRWQAANDIPVSDHALRGHRPIFRALSAGDPEKAVQQMQKHIREWAEWMPADETTVA